jgi:hypothetical protein
MVCRDYGVDFRYQLPDGRIGAAVDTRVLEFVYGHGVKITGPVIVYHQGYDAKFNLTPCL